MTRYLMTAVLVAGLAALISAPADADPKPCNTKNFKTAMVKNACEAGGQKKASKVMNKWVKDVKKREKAKDKGFKLNCKTCHSSLKPEWKLKADALKKFKQFGGS